MFAEGLGFDDVGEGDEADGAFAFFEGEFAECFDVEAVLEIADGAADFDEDDVGLLLDGELAEHVFHFAGDVGDHLDIAAEVSAVPFLVEDTPVDLTGGDEVIAGEVLVEHALVGAEVHVGFHAVVEDEHFTVAVGIEGTGVEVEVALHFDGGDAEAFVFEEFGERGGEDALAEAGHDGAHDDDVACLAAFIAVGQGGVEFGFG